MNELSENTKVLYRERQTELIRTVDAFSKLALTEEWQTIKELVYAKSLEAIERQLLTESLAKDITNAKLYRLQGEYAWAKQYCDTERFIEFLKKQLEEIKLKLA